MKSLLNIFSWIISILAFLVISIIDWDLILFAIFVAIAIKIITNKKYIHDEVDKFKKEVIEFTIQKLEWSWVQISKSIVDKVKISKEKENNVSTNENVIKESVIEKVIETQILENQDEIWNEIKQVNEIKTDFQTKKIQENKVIDNQKIKEYTKNDKKKKEPLKFYLYMKDFFSENIIAKIWWILLALGILFLMWLIYNYVWPVAKIIIWFAFWILVYFTWIFLEKKWYEQEAMVLLWAWILINYIVILSWKYLILDWETWVLSDLLTFWFLILNTILSIVTSFVFKSKTLLLFSLIFSYTIPILTWNIYSILFMVIYSVILSIWWYVIATYYKENDKALSITVQFISLVLWNLLLLYLKIFPLKDFNIVQIIIWFLIINFSSIFLLYKNNFHKKIEINFIISYIFLTFIVFWLNIIWTVYWIILLSISLFLLLIINSLFISKLIIKSFTFILFFPLLIVLSTIFAWEVWLNSILLLFLFLASYFYIFPIFLYDIVWEKFKYLFFLILWVFLIVWNSFINFSLSLDNFQVFDLYTFFSVSLTWFLFLISSYYFSFKKWLNFLYGLWTIITILTLIPIISYEINYIYYSFIIVLTFFAFNYIIPFINKNLFVDNLVNLIIWYVFWAFFVWFNIYKFWDIVFHWISLWIIFVILAIIYFIWWFFMFSSIESKKLESNLVTDKTTNIKIDFIYSVLIIAISFFTISVALLFSNTPIIIELIWLLESSIILFFAVKSKSNILWYIWNFLFWIGIFAWILLFFENLTYINLIWIFIICLLIFFNYYKIIVKSELKVKSITKTLHAIWLFIVYFNIIYILDFSNIGYNLIYSLIFVWTINFIYTYFKDSSFKNTSFVFIILFLFAQINFNYNYIVYSEFSSVAISPYFLNYIINFLSILFFTLHYKFFNDKNNNFYYIIFYSYLFIISSEYIYYYTDNSFYLTIYWGILSLFSVHLWIFKKYEKFRLIWLFVLIITLIKIVFYDIWAWINNEIVRVIAFLLVWWIMIYISSLYKKNNLSFKKDFNLLFLSKITNNNSTKNIVNKQIDQIDVWDKNAVKLTFNWWKKATIRTKNLVKIWKIIIDQNKKNYFKPWELKEFYENFKLNYERQLSKKDYDRVIELLDIFVLEGWIIELI